MFNFLEVLRSGGLGLGYLVVVVLGVATGCLGFYCVKKESENENNWLPWIIFLFFLFLAVCYFFSIPAFLNGEKGKGFAITLIIAILSFLAAIALFVEDSKIALTRNNNHIGWKLFFISISAVMGLLLAGIIMIENDTLFLSQLNQKQKAEWWISEKILKPGSSREGVTEALERIKEYNYPLSPFAGIANLKLGKISEAAKNFRDYANTKQGKEKCFWLGAANYYQGNFTSASLEFELAKKPYLVIISSFKRGNLNQQKLNELKKQFGQIPIVDEIEKTFLPKEMPQKKKKGFEELVWEKLNRLEKLISEKSVLQQTPVPVVSLDKKINKAVFTQICAYEKAPVLPKVDTHKIFWFMISALPVFLTMMFITNVIIRDHLWKEIQNKRYEKWVEKISNLAKKFSWHSFIARKIAAKIALIEKEKGMFSEEIEKIQNAVFPLDVILSLFYLRKTRKIFKVWEINSQEKEDIKYIYQEIKKLAGKLIPQGNEESLIVITALRKKAAQIANAYLKNDINYQKGRISLLATFDELATVGDILEARKTENQISYYSLLGIKIEAKAEEIKKAYRSVIPAVHPDHHQGNPYLQALAMMINVAYATLSNGMRREIYDKQMGF